MARAMTQTLITLLLSLPMTAGAAQFDVSQEDDGVAVKADGQLVTRYIPKSGPKPILWPLIGPTGKEMTRGYPMREALDFEKSDHVHHRSLWFTHGDVNGVDFWSEGANHGDIVHREYLKCAGGKQAIIATRNDWIGPDGKKICEDERTFVIDANDKARWIDVELLVKATEGPVTFGDTKEGSFGVRMWETIKVDAKKGGKIVNSEGKVDGDAWGKEASWVDYYGPIDGEIVGIAIMNHPTSFRYPTPWHVRTYGLFTANPFGLHDFRGSNEVDGSHTLQPGETLLLRYRVVLHQGDAQQAGIAEMFAEYAKAHQAEN